MSEFVKKILQEGLSLMEAKNIGVLYHYCSFRTLGQILKSNRLLPHGADYKHEKCTYGVSLTRDKNFHETGGDRIDQGIGGTSARINLNGNKLSEKYKIRPLNYHSSYGANGFQKPARPYNTESEEFVITPVNGILNLKNYIISVSLFPDKERTKDVKYTAEEVLTLIKKMEKENIKVDIEDYWVEYMNEILESQ
jgi:hypothetical protein